MASHHTLLVLAGPTAVGKTARALEAARYFGTEILSFDSRQCYREMNIGVARPSPAELAEIPHHFIASHSIHDPVNAALFESYSLPLLEKLFQIHQVVVAVGGTGLFLKALLEGMDDMPPVPETIRVGIQEGFRHGGLAWLQARIHEEDPVYARDGELQNPRRIMRALEVKRASGRSIREFQNTSPKARSFRVVKVGLHLDKSELDARIDSRVLAMVDQGLEEEVRSLQPWRDLAPLQTIGYREWIPYLDGQESREQVVKNIQAHTRQYAKRQYTWFRRDAGVQWIKSTDNPAFGELLKSL